MIIRIFISLTVIVTAAFATAAAREPASDDTGTLIVEVRSEAPSVQGSFSFSGIPEGTTTAGGSISQIGIAPGEYKSVESAAPEGLMLVSISCDDSASATPSAAVLERREAIFRLDAGETVTCVFLYRGGDLAESSAGGVPVPPGGPDAAPSGGSADCEAPEMVPRAGSWLVSNFAGRMVCGSMINMPLSPSQETGVLEIRDCGWTVIGTGLADDTAPLTMRAVDATSGRYTGSVGGSQDGIPMMIDFTWQLESDEWIVGDLSSEVTQQGMTCQMSRPFELKYAGP
ncbi:MAG: hypothetical protein PVJ48_08015 [Gammaproteobacteria bacterium]|jgi:hypothetical protein